MSNVDREAPLWSFWFCSFSCTPHEIEKSHSVQRYNTSWVWLCTRGLSTLPGCYRTSHASPSQASRWGALAPKKVTLATSVSRRLPFPLQVYRDSNKQTIRNAPSSRDIIFNCTKPTCQRKIFQLPSRHFRAGFCLLVSRCNLTL